MSDATRHRGIYRAHCPNRCGWTIDSPTEDWARRAGRQHYRKAHQPTAAERYAARYAYRGRLNATQTELLRQADRRSLACHRTTVTADWGTPRERTWEQWYADSLPRAAHHWVRGLETAGLLRPRTTWSRHGVYVLTDAGRQVLSDSERVRHG